MKHSLFTSLALLLVFVLTSCEKPLLTGADSEQKPSGNLVVSVFQIEQTPFERLTRTPAAEACTRLNYAVYNTEGTRVKQVNQESGDEDFGTATFQLDEGNYHVVVVGHSSNGNPTMTNAAKIQFTNSQGFTDTFISSDNVTIAEEQVNLNVSINRIVALCRFVITDDYPANVAKLRFRYTGGSGAFNATTGLGVVKSTQTVWFEDLSTNPKQFDLYTFLHDTTGTIHLTVSAYDASDNVLFEREFDVPMEQNKITWFSGPYFTATSSSTFTVSVNTDWAGELHINF